MIFRKSNVINKRVKQQLDGSTGNYLQRQVTNITMTKKLW
jgi:hypothetical protein